MRPTRAIHILAIALLVPACDEAVDHEHEQPSVGESSTGVSTSDPSMEPAPSCEVEACCACMDHDFVCLASNEHACDYVNSLLGTDSIRLPCHVSESGVLECPDVECSPPVLACCSCVAGVAECIDEPSSGCPSGSMLVAGCEVDVVGGITCDAFAC